ncbi:hypothetical protein B0O99DRAFT_737464 [Bisporella sp. PMI_857]|nr:hypothetical protein B0O99DRAFT_737464 [Bisporella sp. PMI_857]
MHFLSIFLSITLLLTTVSALPPPQPKSPPPSPPSPGIKHGALPRPPAAKPVAPAKPAPKQPPASCITFHARAPYNDDLPFEASITHNGRLTCWISMSYAKHMQIQRGRKVVRTRGDGKEGMRWEFLPWDFECLDGFFGRAGIGRRSYHYRAKGQDISFVAEIKEDVLGGAYLYRKQESEMEWDDGSLERW